jgi:iron complex transport system substrate-binding protein
MIFKDQLNRRIHLATFPVRIVSLVPSQTELLVALGLRDHLVGITKFCVHPPELRKDKIVVGGTKVVHLNKIKALNPDLIICNKEENTRDMVDALTEIAPVWVSNIQTVSDCKRMIAHMGKLFNKSEESKKLINKIDRAQAGFKTFIKNSTEKNVLYLIWKGPYMAAGKETFIDALLSLNRFNNVYTAKEERYPVVEEKYFNKADLILLSSEPYPFTKNHAAVLKKKYKKEVVLVDGEYFSWYGSRLEEAFSYFRSLH